MPKERRETDAKLNRDQLSINEAVVLVNLPYITTTQKVIDRLIIADY